MTMPPLPELIYQHGEETELCVRAYAAAVREAALEEAATLVELEYAKDHNGFMRLKQIAGHIRALKNA